LLPEEGDEDLLQPVRKSETAMAAKNGTCRVFIMATVMERSYSALSAGK
jgi:hypothetical protein